VPYSPALISAGEEEAMRFIVTVALLLDPAAALLSPHTRLRPHSDH
jgi:hypothetical protein